MALAAPALAGLAIPVIRYLLRCSLLNNCEKMAGETINTTS
jgi:hypothetical protein